MPEVEGGGAKQSFAGTHSQAELGNDRVERGEAALRGTHSQAALGNDRVERGEAALRGDAFPSRLPVK